MATTGFELPHRNAGKTAIPDQTGAKCGALGAHSVLIDTDLQAIMEAWAHLPKSTKADMIANSAIQLLYFFPCRKGGWQTCRATRLKCKIPRRDHEPSTRGASHWSGLPVETRIRDRIPGRRFVFDDGKFFHELANLSYGRTGYHHDKQERSASDVRADDIRTVA